MDVTSGTESATKSLWSLQHFARFGKLVCLFCFLTWIFQGMHNHPDERLNFLQPGLSTPQIPRCTTHCLFENPKSTFLSWMVVQYAFCGHSKYLKIYSAPKPSCLCGRLMISWLYSTRGKSMEFAVIPMRFQSPILPLVSGSS